MTQQKRELQLITIESSKREFSQQEFSKKSLETLKEQPSRIKYSIDVSNNFRNVPQKQMASKSSQRTNKGQQGIRQQQGIELSQKVGQQQKNGRQQKIRQQQKRQQTKKGAVIVLWVVAAILMLCILKIEKTPDIKQKVKKLVEEESAVNGISQQKYPQELLELLEKNEETFDFVQGYPQREQYQNQPIDLSKDIQEGEVPLLMQWDKRWGYDLYGDSMIGIAGCGPTCLSMAYLYFTGDTTQNPREIAKFAYENGYYTSVGTSWSLWTEGVEKLGLHGEEIPLSESKMKSALEEGKLIICSMRPGDFTTTGHFILVYDYDENGFYVKDPNRKSNSEKQWDYKVLSGQIKNLWTIFL